MGRGNCDLKIEVEAQNPRKRERTMYEAPGGDREQFAAGHASLDQADQSEFSKKERRGLSRDVLYTRRY
jgi:hypothetical protein